jgi:signal transduction histidine kinase
MLKEKAGEKARENKQKKGAINKGDITKLLFDIANFDFSLKNFGDSIKETKALILKYTGASGCTIMFLDNYGYLWKIGEETTYPFRLGEGVAGWAAKCRKPVFIKDLQKDKRYKVLYGKKDGSIISIPIFKNKKCIGVMNLTYSKEKIENYPPNKVILDIFAKKMSSIIENVFLYHAAEGEKNELRARKLIVNTLEDNISLGGKIEIIRKQISKLTKIKNLSICIKNTKEETLICYGDPRGKKGKTNIALMDFYIKSEGKKHTFLDLSEKLNYNFIMSRGAGYITLYPIFSGGKIIGYILIEDQVKNIDNLSILEKRFIELTSGKIGNYMAQKSSSKKMFEEKERWRTIFHNVDDGIILLSPEKKIIEANLKAREILSSQNANLNGKDFFSFFEVLDPEIEISAISSIKNFDKTRGLNQKDLNKKIDNFFRSHTIMRPKEYYVRTKNGRYWIIAGMKTAMKDLQKNIYGIIHINDITKIKEVEQDKNEFMSMVSHELRTPLSAMKGFLSMTLNEDYGRLNKKQRKSLTRIDESNERMVTLVEDILDVSRIELGRINLHKEPINLSAITCIIVREFGAKIQEKKIKITIQGRTADICLKNIKKDSGHRCRNLHIYVLADRDRLMQILQNLVSNAIKYSFDKGTINIDIKKDKKFAEISIKDGGVGVAKEDYSKLFKRFSRIHNPLSIQAGGTGLGLYITKKLIQEHGGVITVKSQKGKGTTFSVKIPIAKQLPLI